MYSQSVGFQLLFKFTIACTVLLSGCGGTKILKEPLALEITQPLATASDKKVSAKLIWVIIRDGPGTWAKNADWDEYLVNVVNESEAAIRIIDVTIVDSLGVRQATNADYKELVNESKEATKRYKDSNITVKAGIGAGTIMVVGGATILGAGYVGSAAAYASMMSVGMGGASAGAAVGAATVVGGLVVLVPAVVGIGIVRSNNRNKVAREIRKRHTFLPVTINSNEELLLDIFYPLAPSPTQLAITYMVGGVEETLVVNTTESLYGLHLFQDEDEKLKKHLATLGISTTSEVNEIGRDGTFIAYDDGTVLDTETNLMWWFESIKEDDWSVARYKAQTFKGGGYSDWRLPMEHELMTIYDKDSERSYKSINYIKLVEANIYTGEMGDDSGGDSNILYINYKNGKTHEMNTNEYHPPRMSFLPVRNAN